MVLRFAFFLFAIVATAQGQPLFHKIIGTSSPDFGNSGIQVYDNGFIAVGSTGSTGNSDILMARASYNGDLRWQKTVGFSLIDQGNSVIMSIDSGFVVAGYTNSVGFGGYDVLLLKTDTAGNMQWHKTFGGADWDFGYKIINDALGGFVIAGQTYSAGQGNGDGYLVRTDANGNKLWEKMYGGTEEDGLYSMRQTSDGGYVLCGYSKSFNLHGNKEMYVVRTDQTGNVIWEKTFGDTLEFYARDIEENYDGGFIVVGAGNPSSTVADEDLLLIRLSPQGILKNIYTDGQGAPFYVPGKPDYFTGICKMPNNKFYVVGETSNGYGEAWNVIFDSTGTWLSAHAIGDAAHNDQARDQGNSVIRTNFDQYFVVGTTESYVLNLDKNMFIALCDSLGTTVIAPQVYVDVPESVKEAGLKILNNGSSFISVMMPEEFKVKNIQITDNLGKLIAAKFNKDQNQIVINMEGYSSGIYFLTIEGIEAKHTIKLIKP